LFCCYKEKGKIEHEFYKNDRILKNYRRISNSFFSLRNGILNMLEKRYAAVGGWHLPPLRKTAGTAFRRMQTTLIFFIVRPAKGMRNGSFTEGGTTL
jgi:hypothetical protein